MTQLRLIKAAFACDLVRVATFMWASGTSWVVFPGTFQGATVPGSLTSAPHYAVTQSGDQATEDWLSQIDQFYSTATSTVLQEFATTPDIDGNMLIDNTIVVYVTEVARAFDSNQQNMPVILFGGKNTRLNGGTFLKVQDGSLPTQTAAPETARSTISGWPWRRFSGAPDQPGRPHAVHGPSAGRLLGRVISRSPKRIQRRGDDAYDPVQYRTGPVSLWTNCECG